MSMRDYGLADYGLVLSRETMKILASKMCIDYSDEEYEEDEYGFNETVVDRIGAEYVSDFTGEARIITAEGFDGCDEVSYCADTLYYIPCKHFPSLFSRAYCTIYSIVREMSERVGKYLPSDFDYIGNICHIVGTYLG